MKLEDYQEITMNLSQAMSFFEDLEMVLHGDAGKHTEARDDHYDVAWSNPRTHGGVQKIDRIITDTDHEVKDCQADQNDKGEYVYLHGVPSAIETDSMTPIGMNLVTT